MRIIGAIRDRVGRDYPVWARINGRTFGIENGTTLEEALQVAQMIEQAGLDAIHVSGYGGSLGIGFTEAPLVYRPGNLLPAARAIKEAVSVPVIAVGKISPELGEEALRQGKADFIAMGRETSFNLEPVARHCLAHAFGTDYAGHCNPFCKGKGIWQCQSP